MTNETTAATWKPDADKLDYVLWDAIRDHGTPPARYWPLVHAEYQRQLAAAGLVIVRRKLPEAVARWSDLMQLMHDQMVAAIEMGEFRRE